MARIIKALDQCGRQYKAGLLESKFCTFVFFPHFVFFEGPAPGGRADVTCTSESKHRPQIMDLKALVMSKHLHGHEIVFCY